MEFQTRIDYDALKTIISNAPELHEKGYLNQHDPRNQYALIKDRQSCLTIMYEFFKTFDEYGYSMVKYQPKNYLRNGRLWADIPSVQGISRQVRHTICHKTMVDLDMKNAHPTFLRRLCIEHEIHHDHLIRYINDRENVLSECLHKGVVDRREDAKRLMLKIINGGCCFNLDKHGWLRGFANEMSSIRKKLLDDHYPQYLDIATQTKGRNYKNLYGSAINLLLCVKEREVLDKMISFSHQHKLKIGALCHDGFMLIKEEGVDYDECARQMSEQCGMEIVVKEMDEKIPLENMVMRDLDYMVHTIDEQVMKKLDQADNDNPYTMLPLYTQMRPSVIDEFKYLRDADNKHCCWFERRTDGRWFQNQDPLFLSKDIAISFTFYCNEKIKTLKNEIDIKGSDVEAEWSKVQEQCENEMVQLKSGGYTLKQEKEMKKKHKAILKEASTKIRGPLESIKEQIASYSRRKDHFQKSLFRNALINEFRSEVVDNMILMKLDNNKKLLGFENGVYDFERMCFRPIGKDDYIQKSTGYEFPTGSNPEKRKFIENTFKSMFIRKYAIRLTDPDYEEMDDPEQVENYECAMDSIAYSLVGGNDLQRFYIWIGEGSNGKSVTQNAIKKAMGDYSTTIDVCAITHSKNSSNATSDLPKAKGCRQLFTSESESSDVLSQAYVKRLTGREEICEREVYAKSITFTPQFVPFLLTNVKPLLRMEPGIARRVFIVDFKFRFFCSKDEIGFNESEYNKTHFLGKDYNLEDKLEDCKEEFVLFLIERYKNILQRGLIVSKQFVNRTQEYMEEQDELKQFIMEEFVPTTDDDKMTKHKEILNTFNANVPVYKRITNEDLSKKMKELNIFSKIKHQAKYYYISQKTDDPTNSNPFLSRPPPA